MTNLHCSFLGAPSIRWEDGTEVRLPTRHETALLAYLMVEQERPHPRAALTNLLWGEKSEKSARNSLRQTLFRLRQALAPGEAGQPFLHISPRSVQFNPQSRHTLDVLQFIRLLDAWEAHQHEFLAACPECLTRLEQAVSLPAGDFLSGFALSASPAFDEWAAVWRERLHLRLLEAWYHLAEAFLQQGNYQRARRCAWQQIALEPWREEAHRQLMEALARSGHVQKALTQYRACRAILQREFGLPPADETAALYERIRMMPHVPLRRFPSPLTSFVGRSGELTRLSALLARPDVRLITIWGFGGVGKTRLALEAARRQGRAFLNGAVFVPLADVSPQDDLAAVLGAALGIALGGRPPLQAVLGHLRSRELLLVLDNFEHLKGQAGLLSRLLSAAPRLKIMVTSRITLQARGEWLFPLDGLSLEAPPGLPSEAEAVRLFVLRARQVNRNLPPSGMEAAARVCALLDGNPLAIELAASALNTGGVEALERALTVSLTHLRAAWQDTPSRQSSLQATLRYSWALLGAEEQGVLRRLSVFRGGFTAQAACTVAETRPAVLAALARKSLVRRTGPERYDLHPLVRGFAGERLLAEAPEAARTQRTHAAFFTGLLRDLAADWRGENSARALERANREAENIHAAWRRAAALGLYPLLAQALPSFYRWILQRGDFREGIQALEAALKALPPPEAGNAETRLLRGGLLARQGMLAFYLGRHGEARAALEKAQMPLEESRAPRETAFLQNGLGILASARGEFSAAEPCFEAALRLSRTVGDAAFAALTLNNLAILARIRGEYERSADLSRESLAQARLARDLDTQARALQNLGIVARCREQLPQARRFYQESLALFRSLAKPWDTALALGNLGEVCTALQEYRQAQTFLEESLSIRREIGDRSGIVMALDALGGLLMEQGRVEQAEYCLAEALHTAQEVGEEPLELGVLVSLAQLWAGKGQDAKAHAALTRVLAHPGCPADVRTRAGRQLQRLQEPGSP